MRKVILLGIMILCLLMPLLISGCEDNRTLFERYGNGLDILSRDGLTDKWDISVTQGEDTVSVLVMC
jgi:hypothetical protein